MNSVNLSRHKDSPLALISAVRPEDSNHVPTPRPEVDAQWSMSMSLQENIPKFPNKSTHEKGNYQGISTSNRLKKNKDGSIANSKKKLARGKKTLKKRGKASSGHPAKPKRPLSAYNLFFRHERQMLLELSGHHPVGDVDGGFSASAHYGVTKSGKRLHRKSHGIIGFSDLAKSVGMKWKSLDEDTRTYFESQAALEKQRYQRELLLYKAMVHNNGGEELQEVASGSSAASTAHTAEMSYYSGPKTPAVRFVPKGNSISSNTACYTGQNHDMMKFGRTNPQQRKKDNKSNPLLPDQLEGQFLRFTKAHSVEANADEDDIHFGLDIEPLPLDTANPSCLLEMFHGVTSQKSVSHHHDAHHRNLGLLLSSVLELSGL